MTPSARIQAAIELWDKIWSSGVPMDTICGDYFRVRRYIGSSDRKAVVERVYDMMRGYARTGWWLQKARAADTPRTRVIASLALTDQLPRPHINDLFSGSRHAPEVLDQAEMKLVEALVGHTLDHPEMPEDIRHECPRDVFGKIKAVFGTQFADEMTAMLEPASLDIRVNTIKAERDSVMNGLKRHEIETTPTPFRPWGYAHKGACIWPKQNFCSRA